MILDRLRSTVITTTRRVRAAVVTAVVFVIAVSIVSFAARSQPCHSASIVAVIHDRPLIIKMSDGHQYVNLDGQLAYPREKTVTLCKRISKAERKTSYTIDGANVELWDDRRP